MDSKAVSRELRTAIRPVLQTHGFRLFTDRTAWRHSDDRIDVVHFQSLSAYNASVIGTTTFSFGVILGQWLCCVPPEDFNVARKKGLLAPQVASCQLQTSLETTLPQYELVRRDVWHVAEDGASLADVVRDARSVILERGLDWFARHHDDRDLFALLTTAPGSVIDGTRVCGNLGSSARDHVLGYLALRLGDRHTARQLLSSTLMRHRERGRSLMSPRSTYRPPAWDRLAADVAALDADGSPGAP